jgi:Transposase DDE domain
LVYAGSLIIDGQSVKTTERGGARGFDAHKRVKGRKRHILVDTLNLLVANRVEPADTSDRHADALLLGGLSALFPRIRTVIADAGHQSRKLARTLKQDQGWQLRIVKRRERAFKIEERLPPADPCLVVGAHSFPGKPLRPGAPGVGSFP